MSSTSTWSSKWFVIEIPWTLEPVLDLPEPVLHILLNLVKNLLLWKTCLAVEYVEPSQSESRSSQDFSVLSLSGQDSFGPMQYKRFFETGLCLPVLLSQNHLTVQEAC